MDPFSTDRWHQIDRLFAAALERSPAERAAFLAAACQGDAELLRAVTGLLRSAEAAEAELGESVSRYAEPLLDELRGGLEDDETAALPEGGRVGPYRVLREIGRGGMGAVYLAERADGQFQKQVALKLVKRGMDTDEVLRRFRHERQILASLEHPNIARLYDGGVAEDGRPYLVMEHIEGAPITRFCDDRRLPVEERLRLFVQVCEAVQFAHRSLVIHRDIKPSNVLVTSEGVPKLLDFGIAKLLDPALPEARTRTEARLLTPEYAAPEQARGEPVTTATDVYALGVVLYELLAGRRPPERAGRTADDAGQAERPSTALARSAAPGPAGARELPLDEVAARRSTSPERLRRRLRGDLDTITLRALAPEPERRYPSAGQLGADVERHLRGLPVEARGDSAGYRARKFVRRHRAGVLAATMVTLSLVGGLGAAATQAYRASRERDLARHEHARAEQVSAFLLDLFGAADPLAAATDRVDTLRVHHLLERGAQRVRDELRGQPLLQAQMLATLGRVYTSLGLYANGQPLLRDALMLQDRFAARAADRASTLAVLGNLHQQKGEHARADSLYRQVLALYRSERLPPDSLYVASLSERGIAQGYLGEAEAAAALHREALDILRRGGRRHTRLYSSVLNNLAIHHHGAGEYAEAEPLIREALEIDRRVYGPGHAHVAIQLNNLASAVHYQKRYREAEPIYREAIALGRRAFPRAHPYSGNAVENLATLYDDQREFDRAEPLYREALRIYEGTYGRRSMKVALLLRNLALNRHAVNDLAEAETLLRESLATLEATVGRDDLYTGLARISLGRVLASAGRADDAMPLFSDGVAVLKGRLPADHWRIHSALADLGAGYTALGRYARAEPLLLQAHAALRAQKGPGDYSTVEAAGYLVRLYTAWGRPERAAAFR